jgi:hypothetical protein
LPVTGGEAPDHSPSDPAGTGVAKSAKPSPKGFQKGASGVPKGRSRGARNQAILIAEQPLDSEADEITRKAIGLAKDDNLVALRLCLERILSPQHSLAVSLKHFPLGTPSDLPTAYARILGAVLQSVGKEVDSNESIVIHYLALVTFDGVPDMDSREPWSV